MSLTRIRQIIKEELNRVLKEQEDGEDQREKDDLTRGEQVKKFETELALDWGKVMTAEKFRYRQWIEDCDPFIKTMCRNAANESIKGTVSPNTINFLINVRKGRLGEKLNVALQNAGYDVNAQMH